TRGPRRAATGRAKRAGAACGDRAARRRAARSTPPASPGGPAVAGVGRKPDQEGAELAALAIAERPQQLALGAPGCLACSLHCPPPVRRQLDAVTSSVGRIRGAGQKPPVLELVQQSDQVAGLDPKREGQVTLRDRTLRVEVVQNRELGPSQPALVEA